MKDSDSAIFEEVDGILAVEAEHYFKQTKDETRRWYIFTEDHQPEIEPDADKPHIEGASGGAYLEILPDTRRNHVEPLIRQENFTEAAGSMAVLEYRVYIHNPGRYYIWVRSCPTNTEDNGIHAGIDGVWPPSGRRGQMGRKNEWTWTSKQRTNEVHTGVPFLHYLDIEEPGEHTIMFSMREDGFEFDKFVLANSKQYKPERAGPEPILKSGSLPDISEKAKAQRN